MSNDSSSRAYKTDIEGLRRMRDEDIDLSDIPEITPEQFSRSVLRKGLKRLPPTGELRLRIDADVLEWFKSHGEGYQSLINAVLREYMKARQER